MKISEILARKIEVEKQVKEMRAVFKENATAAISTCLKAVFEFDPNLKAIRWTQYSPYFNDGDACEFSANTDDTQLLYASKETEDQEEDEEPDYEGGWEDSPYIPWNFDEKSPEEQKELMKDKELALLIRAAFEPFNDDDMETMFGNHVRVVVYRDGKVETEEYDHH